MNGQIVVLLVASPAFAHTLRLCVKSAPNPEFASSPANYAHWFLAHAYPTIVSLHPALENYDTAGQAIIVEFALVHGENERLRDWSSQYQDLFAPWQISFLDISIVATFISDTGETSFEVPLGKGSNIDAECRRRGLAVADCNNLEMATREYALAHALRHQPDSAECSVNVSVYVPHLSFCTEAYWTKVNVFAHFVRDRFKKHVRPHARLAPPHVFILLRSGPTDRTWDVEGLSAACSSKLPWADLGVDVTCGTFSKATPLSEVARVLGSSRVLISAHGAGLANCVFLPPAALVYELDAHAHRKFNRHFYQIYARRLGLNPAKIWLDEHGVSHAVHWSEMQNCTMYHDENNSAIIGKSEDALRSARILPYTHPIRLKTDSALLRELILSARSAPPFAS